MQWQICKNNFHFQAASFTRLPKQIMSLKFCELCEKQIHCASIKSCNLFMQSLRASVFYCKCRKNCSTKTAGIGSGFLQNRLTFPCKMENACEFIWKTYLPLTMWYCYISPAVAGNPRGDFRRYAAEQSDDKCLPRQTHYIKLKDNTCQRPS